MVVLRAIAAALFALAGLSVAYAQAPEPRIALVIGNSNYKAGALTTPANDAGLVAQTLTQAGFDVIGARDLDQDGLRRSFRDFLDKAAASGPDTVAFVYLAGYGLQYAGENYFVPVEATIARDSSVPIEALRLSDFTRALADIPLKARFVTLDAARANPFAPTGQLLAGGLALVEPEQGTLLAFNTAPGAVPPAETGDYGAYAKALAEMMQQGGLAADEVFARTRLRVSEATRGAQVPWDASRLTTPVTFFERAPDAPPVAAAEPPRNRAIRGLPAPEAYALALERDTIAGYQEFIDAYPRDPLSPRVEAMLAARREALTWRRAVARNTPDAYWSYLRRYPRGPHLADARRRLAILSAAYEPPAQFEEYDFDVPPPPREEYEYISGPVMIFDDADYPPPPPIYFLPPPPREYIDLPPPRFISPGILPVIVPVFLPSARPWRPVVTQQPIPVRLPTGVTPRDPGQPPRFVAPIRTRLPQNQQVAPQLAPQQLAPQQQLTPQQRLGVQPALQPPLTPGVAQPLRRQDPRQPLIQDPQRDRRDRALQLQQSRRDQQLLQQRDRQMRAQQSQQQMREQKVQQQRERLLRAQQGQQQLRAQQFQQQRDQQQRVQRYQQQREQQIRGQQLQQQREQQLRARQFQQQREQQSRAQQFQMRAQQQQQIMQQRAQQQQQMQQRVQQQQQQMQQRAQQQQMMQQRVQQQQQMMQQRAQQQQRQQPQQRPQRGDCGTPGKPPCR